MAEPTEEPTPRRLDEARRRGDVAKSRDLASFAIFASGLLSFVAFGPSLVLRIRDAFTASATALTSRVDVEPAALLLASLASVLRGLAPFLASVTCVALAVGLFESGFLVAFVRVVPDVARLDPTKRLASLVSARSVADAARALGVVVAILYVVASAFAECARDATVLVGREPSAVLRALPTLALLAGKRVLAVLAAAALVDVFVSRRRHLAGLRMTRADVAREARDGEGDPHAKNARAALHREILEHQILASVRDADVLVVNPTHLAVALRFDLEGDAEAPTVVAKGEDALAKRMIEIAHASGVPVMRDIPLARGLFGLELGDEIPESLYVAVAAVLRAAWDERGGDAR